MLSKKDSPKSETKSPKTTKASATHTTASQPLAQNSTTTATHTPKQTTSTTRSYATATKQAEAPERKTQQKTRIVIKYDVGYSNHLTIRGKGANLSWDHGQPLKNVRADEWIWETDASFPQCEFKILLNDQHYEQGANHMINSGAHILYTPKF